MWITSTGDSALESPCKSCGTAADELLVALDKVKVNGKQDKWKSIRKALRSFSKHTATPCLNEDE